MAKTPSKKSLIKERRVNYTRLPPTNNHELELNTQFAYLYSGLITHLYRAFQRVRYHLFFSELPMHLFLYNSCSFTINFIGIVRFS